ncbi:hydrolase [Yeosuana sp.]|mgnify:FL=1|uniref:hydrolase n=1 Tax=Yeosuana sp. TaxID=2529388 RepID=UPI00405521A9|tara:strand:+ start:1473 stop:1973 length:501 start_codon:yes stop_codon:yes gene_type:complete
MKRQIFIYLFIFSTLIILFQYVNSKRLFEIQNKKIDNFETRIETYQDSLASLQDEVLNVSHFNLERNEEAITYFENKGYDVNTLIPFIKDEIYKLNEVSGEHPLIPYAASSGRKMMINTVKLLNHKWIIADFSDGEFWGELFLTYEITENKELKFNVVESFLYPNY